MGDLFHKDVPNEFIERVFETMREASQHTFMILTKRPERLTEYWRWWQEDFEGLRFNRKWFSNIWIGTSVSTQADVDRNLPHLLRCPAAVRFISAEPLLAEIDIREYLQHDDDECCPECRGEVGCNSDGTWNCIAIHGIEMGCGWTGENPDVPPSIAWVIAGCESGPSRRHAYPGVEVGPGRRHVSLDAFRSLRDQCVSAGAPFFLKQAEIDGRLVTMPALDGRVWDQLPATETTLSEK
jgi:protein gp37